MEYIHLFETEEEFEEVYNKLEPETIEHPASFTTAEGTYTWLDEEINVDEGYALEIWWREIEPDVPHLLWTFSKTPKVGVFSGTSCDEFDEFWENHTQQEREELFLGAWDMMKDCDEDPDYFVEILSVTPPYTEKIPYYKEPWLSYTVENDEIGWDRPSTLTITAWADSGHSSDVRGVLSTGVVDGRDAVLCHVSCEDLWRALYEQLLVYTNDGAPGKSSNSMVLQAFDKDRELIESFSGNGNASFPSIAPADTTGRTAAQNIAALNYLTYALMVDGVAVTFSKYDVEEECFVFYDVTPEIYAALRGGFYRLEWYGWK